MTIHKNNTFIFNLDDPKLKETCAFAQIIPLEMMAEIKKAAAGKNISVDMEITTRLLATIIEPESFGINSKLQQFMNRKIVEAQAKIESELKRKGWLYIYELDKLKMLISLEDKLPKKFKEKFLLLDVAKESVRIRAELAEEKQQRGELE